MSKRIIVVVTAGWVVVGTQAKHNDAGRNLNDASVIRKWGTSRGLGQLAIEGPTEETVLDPCGEVFIPNNAVVLTIDVQHTSKL